MIPILFSNTGDPSPEFNEEQVGEVCIANISPKERQLRMRFGIAQMVFGVIVLVILVVLNVNPLWRLPLVFLFGAAAVGYFQAKDKT
jgi:hypothetical protein